MAGNTSGSARDRGLGAELRQAREARGISLRKLASQLGWDPSKLSRLETGQLPTTRPEDVATVLMALDAPPDMRDRLVGLAAEPNNGHSWSPVTIPEQEPHLNAYLAFERTAIRVTEVCGIVPGLLQAPRYRRTIIERESPPDKVEQRVAIRAGRREALFREVDPLHLVAYVGEAALDAMVGGNDAMIEQLEHLLSMGKLPNVELHIIPTRSDYHPGMIQNFALFEFRAAPPLVHTETRWSGWFLHEEADVESQREAIGMVDAVALDPQLSAEMVAKKLADRMESR